MPVPNADHQLKSGTFARIEILPRAKSDVVLVPREAVRREEGRTQVLVVRDGRLEAQPVQIGIVSEDAVEVLRGVRVDDEIVVGDSVRSAAPGMRVQTVPVHRAGGIPEQQEMDGVHGQRGTGEVHDRRGFSEPARPAPVARA